MNSPEAAAAVWSALAATVSAASALLALRFSRANLQQSVRPELHLLNWSREELQRGDFNIDTVKVSTLANLGRGAALRVHINLENGWRRGRIPLATMSTSRCPIVAAGEKESVDLEISLHWKNVKEGRTGGKFIAPSIVVYAWDTLDRRHVTSFDLFVVPPAMANSIASEQVAPGVSLAMRSTTSRPTWSLKLQMRLSRLPGLGRFTLR